MQANQSHGAFLSTPSVRRATGEFVSNLVDTVVFLSTPSVRRATLGVSVHELIPEFLSTPSVRRATCMVYVDACETWEISIHALRAEGDDLSAPYKMQHKDFYPRPPCGGRLL